MRLEASLTGRVPSNYKTASSAAWPYFSTLCHDSGCTTSCYLATAFCKLDYHLLVSHLLSYVYLLALVGWVPSSAKLCL